MSLSSGSRLGQYEIVAPLGAGGMGEVYRARDTRLGREVAIKILPEGFAHDPERVARFQREAQLLAALNHPHIAAIHGLEEDTPVHSTGPGQAGSRQAATRFLVLELVDGETLADRLQAGAMPVAEALGVARQIADALEAAHEKGIIHRDLKPANIAFTKEGQVKVLDFGLAKALDPQATPDVSNSPTLTAAATLAGVILGTAAYMSPEQAKGRVADKRSDVWAFGCVLYEMLTARRAFDGEDVTDTIAAVVRGEPDWSALPPDLPDQIRLLIKRCLEKDRGARVADISTARFLMTETISAPLAPAIEGVSHVAPAARGRLVFGTGIGLIAGVAVAGIAVWTVARFTPERAAQTVRLTFVPPATQPFFLLTGDRGLAISPDGSQLVYRSSLRPGSLQLMVRALNNLDARPLPGTDNARQPFVSADNHWVGFFAGGELKKLSLAGGPPITVGTVTGIPRGASWSPDDTVVFATSDTATGLLSVSANGGEPRVLTKPDVSRGELDHLFPSVLPGGQAVLFTIMSKGITVLESGQIAALDLRTGQQKTLVRGGSQAEYVEPGYLVYGAAGALRAARFDLGRLEVLSDPVPVIEQVVDYISGASEFAVSRMGSLVFVPNTPASFTGVPRSLVWVNRQGREEPINAPPRTYAVPRISPDGKLAALDIRDRGNDIWMWDFSRQTLTPLTFNPTIDLSPVWTADGTRLIWSAQAPTPNLFWQSANGTGVPAQLTAGDTAQFPTAISRDGTRLVLFTNSQAAQDIAMLTLRNPSTGPPTSPAPVEALIHTAAAELNPEVSPDGRWLAYQSNKSGQFEIYVSPFPDVAENLWTVSPDGGTRPAWSRNGRELFYLDANNLLTAVPIETASASFSPGKPQKILKTAYYAGSTPGGLDLRGYDISPDGQRFLMIKDNASAGETTTPSGNMVVVLNWVEELKARVSGGK